jgi:4-hydroxy-tetrahydrodipicolinate synthase
MTRSKAEMKKWAKAHMKGVENTLFPSFTPDMKALDEGGIRLDVQQSIRHGFFSMMCATETGLTLEEAKRFVEIAADEAGDKILVTTSLILDSLEDNMELMLHAEKAGLAGVLLGYPPTFHPEEAEEVYRVTRQFCEATNMHVTLYPSPHFHFTRFHNSGFPLDILARLADLPNVVAIKVGEMGLYADVHRLIGDRVLLGCPVERFVPLLIQGFGMQWMGAGCYEVFQSPEKPYLVEYFNLLLEGKADAAMQIYWKLTPMRNIFEAQFGQSVMSGTYNWHQQKYYQWCVGGNGGLTRQPAMKIHPWEADAIKMGYFTIDITPAENDAEFFMGKINYRRMFGDQALAAAHTPVTETMAGAPLQTPSGAAPADAIALSEELLAALKQTQGEMERLPALIRPIASNGFKNKSGQSIKDWIKTAEALTASLKTAQGRAGDVLPAQFPNLIESLGRLQQYYHDAPAENARNIKDEAVRQEMARQMTRRAAIVAELIVVLNKA